MDLSVVILSSPRLLLKPFGAGDAEEAWAASTRTLTRFMGWVPAPSLEAYELVWRSWQPMLAAGTDVHFTVRIKTSGEFAGMAGLHDIANDEPEIGIWIKEARHGLGFGAEAVAVAIRFAGELGKPAVIYPVVEINTASRRLAERLGGVVVGSRNLRRASGEQFPEVVYRIPARRVD